MPTLPQKKCATWKTKPGAERREQGQAGTGNEDETGKGRSESGQVLGEEGAQTRDAAALINAVKENSAEQ